MLRSSQTALTTFRIKEISMPKKYIICRSAVARPGENFPRTIQSFFTGFSVETTTWGIWDVGFRAAIQLPKGVAKTLSEAMHKGDPTHNYWITDRETLAVELHIKE